MKNCITTSHLYGMGGGAKAVFACASALARHGSVTIFTRTAVPKLVMDELPKDKIALAAYYPGCSRGYNVHLNIDHFRYEEPLAKDNVAHIFHPHGRNEPPKGYRLVANSAYTKDMIGRVWGLDSSVLYLSIESDYYVGVKEPMILHVSRFSAPTQYADKGHRQMIQAFRYINEGWRLVMIGSLDPAQHGYFQSLMSEAAGLDVTFAVDQSRERLLEYMSKASVYWHMTGITMPEVHGAQEHLGLTTIEAMASGCVPIVRGTGGQLEIVENGLTGVHVMDTKSLVRATNSVISNMSMMSIISQQALRAGRAWMGDESFNKRFDQAVFDGSDNEIPSPNGEKRDRFTTEDVAIIIPVYNSVMVGQVLDMIEPGPEVIVVDNGSEEHVSHDRIDKYVRLEGNTGFSKANMIGFERTDKPLILALNDDCVPPSNGLWLDIMVETVNENGVGVVGAKLIYPDGRLQHSGILFDWSREDIGYHRLYGHFDQPAANQLIDMPAVTGACLLARRELFDMRPDLYPMGNYEDAHLCLNAWENGWRVVYQPAAQLTHYEGVTKRSMDIDFITHNRDVFVRQWRDKFLDSDEMRVTRRINNEVRGV